MRRLRAENQKNLPALRLRRFGRCRYVGTYLHEKKQLAAKKRHAHKCRAARLDVNTGHHDGKPSGFSERQRHASAAISSRCLSDLQSRRSAANDGSATEQATSPARRGES